MEDLFSHINVIQLATALAALFTAIYTLGFKVASIEGKLKSVSDVVAGLPERLVAIELKANTTWEFLVRRAISESVQKGVATVNSPIEINPKAKEWIAGLTAELKRFYRQLGRELSYSDLLLEIEREFGERLNNEVCIPNGLFEGACLVLAAEVAKEELPEETKEEVKQASQAEPPQQ